MIAYYPILYCGWIDVAMVICSGINTISGSGKMNNLIVAYGEAER